MESIDIGLYNTCPHDCKYCYANYSQKLTSANISKYDPNSPLLCSTFTNEDKVSVRNVKSLIDKQITLF